MSCPRCIRRFVLFPIHPAFPSKHCQTRVISAVLCSNIHRTCPALAPDSADASNASIATSAAPAKWSAPWFRPTIHFWRTSFPCGAAISPAPTATSSTIFPSRCRIEEMNQRIDHLGALGTSVVTFSGGEPLLHPELDDLIRHIRKNGMIAGLDHQRLSAGRRSHPAAESRRPRPSADHHR